MSEVLRYLPTNAELSITLDAYETFIRIAKRDERERIIELLEETECRGEDDWCSTIAEVVALIEGEQK